MDNQARNERVYAMPFGSVYPHYVNKVERKGRTVDELHQVITWLTGYDEDAIAAHVEAGTSFEAFFDGAALHPNASLITGAVCGVKVQEIADPLMRKLRYLDKLVDELAKGKAMEKILRS